MLSLDENEYKKKIVEVIYCKKAHMRLTSIVTRAITELFSEVILLILDGPNSSSLPSGFDFKTGKTSQVPRVRDLNRFVCRLIGTTIIFFFFFPRESYTFASLFHLLSRNEATIH